MYQADVRATLNVMSIVAVDSHLIASPSRRRKNSEVPLLRQFADLRAELRTTSVNYVVPPVPPTINVGPDFDVRADLPVLAALARAGSRFVVRSAADAAACITAGAAVDEVVLVGALARPELATAATLGVRTFVVATPEAVADIAMTVPGAAVLAQVGPPTSVGKGSQPRARTPGLALGLLRQAAASGLEPAGCSLRCAGAASRESSHRGWRWALGASAQIFSRLRDSGQRPWLMDLGCAFPRSTAVLATGSGCEAPVSRQLQELFGAHQPTTMACFA